MNRNKPSVFTIWLELFTDPTTILAFLLIITSLVLAVIGDALEQYQEHFIYLFSVGGLLLFGLSESGVNSLILAFAGRLLTQTGTVTAELVGEGIDAFEARFNFDIPDDIEVDLKDVIRRGLESLGLQLVEKSDGYTVLRE